MEKHIFLGLMIPVVFFGFTGLVKSLVKKEWLWSNFYLGIDVSLAALANGIINLVDGAHQMEINPAANLKSDPASQMYYTALCLMLAVGALLGTMALHQVFENLPIPASSIQRTQRGIWLGVVANLLGGAVLAIFIYMKLRRLV